MQYVYALSLIATFYYLNVICLDGMSVELSLFVIDITKCCINVSSNNSNL